VVLQWLVGATGKDVDLEKAQRALETSDRVVHARKEAAKAATNPVEALALVEQAEKQQQLVSNVVQAMLPTQEKKHGSGASGQAAVPETTAGPKAAVEAPLHAAADHQKPVPSSSAEPKATSAPKEVPPTDPEAEAAFNAANAALDKALAEAEVVLQWLVGATGKDVDLEKAQRALETSDRVVHARKEAAKAATNPVEALALVEQAEKQQQLVSNVVQALRSKQAAQQALGPDALGPEDPMVLALKNANEALDQSLDDAKMMLSWLALGSANRNKDVDLDKLQAAMKVVSTVIESRKEQKAKEAADPLEALEEMQRQEQLVNDAVVEAVESIMMEQNAWHNEP